MVGAIIVEWLRGWSAQDRGPLWPRFLGLNFFDRLFVKRVNYKTDILNICTDRLSL